MISPAFDGLNKPIAAPANPSLKNVLLFKSLIATNFSF
jgi:hypothetical protein